MFAIRGLDDKKKRELLYKDTTYRSAKQDYDRASGGLKEEMAKEDAKQRAAD
ncbi:MAG: hypothetical protein IKP65_04400 [Alphaproteobacteria bacterium]|nr:hypothetical protein [Alphaproteobacteria bacterium]